MTLHQICIMYDASLNVSGYDFCPIIFQLQFSHQGQICVAPDYVLCSPSLEARLVPLLAKNLVTFLRIVQHLSFFLYLFCIF